MISVERFKCNEGLQAKLDMNSNVATYILDIPKKVFDVARLETPYSRDPNAGERNITRDW
jgi:hypothetical protein